MKKNGILFFFAATVLFGQSCQNQKQTAEGSVETKSKTLLVLGSGGGFTGLWTGYELDTLGNVYSWQGESADSSEKKLSFKLSSEKLQHIRSIISDEKLIQTEENSPGNFSYLIKIKSGKNAVWNNQSKSADYLSESYETLLSVIEDKDKLDQETAPTK